MCIKASRAHVGGHDSSAPGDVDEVIGVDRRAAAGSRREAAYGSGACVELAAAGELIALRNSRSPEIVLHFTKAEIAALIEGSRDGDFDHLVQ